MPCFSLLKTICQFHGFSASFFLYFGINDPFWPFLAFLGPFSISWCYLAFMDPFALFSPFLQSEFMNDVFGLAEVDKFCMHCACLAKPKGLA